MMEYALMIYADERQAPDATPEETEAGMDLWWKYEAWLAETGIKVTGEALHDTSQATTVRMKDGAAITTDGPFAETKEQLGGYYLVEASSLDEAIEWAAKIPGARHGSVEVRPVMVFEEDGS
jgi:hypothetical protein